MLLLTLDLEKFDPCNMHKIYDTWPTLAQNAYNSDLKSVDFKNIDHIVFAGMGGSGAIGDLFCAILSKDDIHVSVVKGYLLPKTVDAHTLVVVTSVSGNTVEALTVLNSAKKLDCKLIAFCSGGKMESYCKSNQIAFRKIDQIHSPRASFVTFVYSMLKVLNSILPINKQDVLESLQQMRFQSEKISSTNLNDSNPSLNLAKFLDDIACIYYPYGLYSAATRFKNSLQENAKMHVFTDDIIEACHNGIVSWETSSRVLPVLIRGIDDYEKTKQRWEILKRFFTENHIKYFEVLSVPGNILSKIINLIYLLDYASIYRAVLSKVDPTPVKSIDFIKNHLK